jgi:hypothetical protein
MKSIPPSQRITAIERAKPRKESGDQHPPCQDCEIPADITISTVTEDGTAGYLDLCFADLKKRMEGEQGFSNRVLAGVIGSLKQ